MDYQTLAHDETIRKDKLLNLFELLELVEQSELKKIPGKKKYDRVFKGTAIVDAIQKSSLRLTRTNGQKLGTLMVTPEICELIRVGDEFVICAGLRGKEWRVLFLMAIISRLIPPEVRAAVMH